MKRNSSQDSSTRAAYLVGLLSASFILLQGVFAVTSNGIFSKVPLAVSIEAILLSVLFIAGGAATLIITLLSIINFIGLRKLANIIEKSLTIGCLGVFLFVISDQFYYSLTGLS